MEVFTAFLKFVRKGQHPDAPFERIKPDDSAVDQTLPRL